MCSLHIRHDNVVDGDEPEKTEFQRHSESARQGGKASTGGMLVCFICGWCFSTPYGGRASTHLITWQSLLGEIYITRLMIYIIFLN